MAGFRSRQSELNDLGVGLTFIGSGNALMAADFRAELGLEVPVWVDPKRLSYRHLGFKHQRSLLFHPSVWRSAARAWKAGFRQTRTLGDPWQQGGVLVVRRGGALAWGFASATAGDHPSLDLVLAEARAATR